MGIVDESFRSCHTICFRRGQPGKPLQARSHWVCPIYSGVLRGPYRCSWGVGPKVPRQHATSWVTMQPNFISSSIMGKVFVLQVATSDAAFLASFLCLHRTRFIHQMQPGVSFQTPCYMPCMFLSRQCHLNKGECLTVLHFHSAHPSVSPIQTLLLASRPPSPSMNGMPAPRFAVPQ